MGEKRGGKKEIVGLLTYFKGSKKSAKPAKAAEPKKPARKKEKKQKKKAGHNFSGFITSKLAKLTEKLSAKKEAAKKPKQEAKKEEKVVKNETKIVKHETKNEKGVKKPSKAPKKLLSNIIFAFIVLFSAALFILYHKEILVFNKWVWVMVAVINLTIILFILNIVLKIHSNEKKTVVVKHISTQRSSRNKTTIDLLYDFVKLNKKVSFGLATKELSIPKEKAEELVKILEDNDLITVHYPAFGDAQLESKNVQQNK